MAGIGAAVSALDFCSITMSLAVGNKCGLVRNILCFGYFV